MKLPFKLLLLAATGAAVAAGVYALFEQGYLRLNYPSESEFPIQGVDVSHHNGDIDWPRLAGAGMDFAYIKASEGASFRDDRFLENWQGARRAGLVPGAYHFYSLCAAPELQAANFLSAVPPESLPSLAPAVDLEFGGNCRARPTPAQLRADLRRFLDVLQQAWSRPVVLYVTPDFYPVYMQGQFPDHPIWIRSIYRRPHLPDQRPWQVWQYANRGHLDGAQGFIDLNVYAGSAEQFRSWVALPPPGKKEP